MNTNQIRTVMTHKLILQCRKHIVWKLTINEKFTGKVN